MKKRQYAVIISVAAVLGFLAQFQWVGSIIIVVFGAIALWKHVPSRVAFQMAILSLILVPIAIIMGRWTVSQNFGAYGFLLFVVGLVLLTAELRRSVVSRK